MRSIHLLTPGLPGILVQPTADWMRQAVHLYGEDGNLIGEENQLGRALRQREAVEGLHEARRPSGDSAGRGTTKTPGG
jgi:hypothetical protein